MVSLVSRVTQCYTYNALFGSSLQEVRSIVSRAYAKTESLLMDNTESLKKVTQCSIAFGERRPSFAGWLGLLQVLCSVS